MNDEEIFGVRANRGKVSDEMFKSFKYGSRLDEPGPDHRSLGELTLGLGLSPTSQKEKIPQVTKLSQLSKLARSLQRLKRFG